MHKYTTEEQKRGHKMEATAGRLLPLNTFGKRLRVIRTDRGLSQVELRDQMKEVSKVSIGETYISELERTSRMPTLGVAAGMAKVLDVSLDYLGLVVDEPISFRRESESEPA